MTATFRHARLDNGLTIIAEIMPEAHSASAGFFVKTGARDESASLMGVSHFLEHMMFKGTDDLTAEDINQGFDTLGARNNAFTSNEMTCFYAQVLPDVLDDALGLLARMMRPALRNDDFETERGVILEEIAMYQDNPFWVLYEETTQRLFEPHPLGHRVLGTEETIRSLQRDAMAQYFEDRYAADNTTLALAGAIDFDQCVQIAEQHCSNWKSSRPSRDAAPPRTATTEFTLKRDNVHRAYMLGLGIGPSAQSDDRYAAAIAAQLLGQPENSALHWALIESGLADEAQAAFDAHDGIGEYFVYASCDPDQADNVWKTVQEVCEQFVDDIDDDDLVRIRAKVATAATIGAERPMDRMQRLGRNWLSLGAYRSLDDELAAINAVEAADILRVVHDSQPLLKTCGRLMPA